MKSYLPWLGTLLLSAVAMGDVACQGRCAPTQFCRWFDLPKLCKDSGACSLPAGMSILPGEQDGDKTSFGRGHFEHVWSPDSITIPLSGVAAVLAKKPDLEVVLHASAPLSLDGITILVDGQVAACHRVEDEEGASHIALDCAIPPGAKELKFEYVVKSSIGTQGNVAFDLEMFLHERQGFCTGTEEVCAL